MTINWTLITVLFCLSLPGSCIAMKRLIYFLLPDNTEMLKKRFTRLAIIQCLIMVLILCFAGTVLSSYTHLQVQGLEDLLQGKVGFSAFLPMLLPTFLYSSLGLIIFCGLYYGVIGRILDEKSLLVMANLRKALGIDGCVLYGGVVEEIIARWGLMNLVAFFAITFAKQNNSLVIWMAIIFSGLLFAAGQIPAYLAAGCVPSRRFMYSLIVLSLWQSIVFGFLFWQYGLISAILAHMLFHLGWAGYDLKK